jgi:hypothetical protein
MHFTSIFKRIRKIKNEIFGISNDDNNIFSAIDSSGFKITFRSEYLGNKWNKKRKGWIKLHVAINVNNFKIIDYLITDEHTNDAKEGKKIIKIIKDRIKKLFGDKAYDSKGIYNILVNKAIIPVRKNASTLSKGSPARAKTSRSIKKHTYNVWAKLVNYGKRWHVEIYFLGIKRMFGETLLAVKRKYIEQELMMKVYFYNEFRKLMEMN